MPRPTPTSASPELVAAWLDRRRRLDALILARPEDPSAWVWQLRHQILTYLLHRYGEPALIDALLLHETSSPASPPASDLVTKWPACAPGVETAADAEAPLRASPDFRRKLMRLQSLNRPRYTAAAEEREAIDREREMDRARSLHFSLSYPEEGFELPDNALQEEQRALMKQSLDALADLMPHDDTLTDTEIVALLSANLD